jgi:hypothetical protein
MSEDAGVKPRAVATSALAVRRSNHFAHPFRLDLITEVMFNEDTGIKTSYQTDFVKSI